MQRVLAFGYHDLRTLYVQQPYDSIYAHRLNQVAGVKRCLVELQLLHFDGQGSKVAEWTILTCRQHFGFEPQRMRIDEGVLSAMTDKQAVDRNLQGQVSLAFVCAVEHHR